MNKTEIITCAICGKAHASEDCTDNIDYPLPDPPDPDYVEPVIQLKAYFKPNRKDRRRAAAIARKAHKQRQK